MPRLDEVKRRNGDTEAILQGLASKSPIFRFQAICGAVNHSVYLPEVLDRIKTLTNDDERVMGYSVSMLAQAALVRAGVAEYGGDDSRVLRLIQTPVWFDVAQLKTK